MGFIGGEPHFRFPIFAGENFFKETELKQVEVLFEPLFPASHEEGVPGATDAKAAHFLSQLLMFKSEYHMIPIWQNEYKKWLPKLDQVAREKYNMDLQDLSFEKSNELITSLQAGELENLDEGFGSKEQKDFFKLLLMHCIRGCFADPRWGGNSNGIMWRWLGWIVPAEDIDFSSNDTTMDANLSGLEDTIFDEDDDVYLY